MAYAQKSTKLSEKLPDSRILIAKNLKIIGFAYARKNNFLKAKHYILSALDRISPLEYEVKKELEAELYAQLAGIYSITYVKSHEAETYINKALKILNASHFFYNDNRHAQEKVSSYIAKHKGILGHIYCRNNKYEEAIEHGFKESDYIIDHALDNSHDISLKARNALGIGEALLRKGQLKAAENKLSESISIFERLIGKHSTFSATVFRAETRTRLGNLVDAYKDCEVALNMERKTRSNYLDLLYLMCIYNAALIKYKQSDIKKSLGHLEDFFKNANIFCKSFLDEKTYNTLKSKGVFISISANADQINNNFKEYLKEYFQHSAEIFSAIYGTSHPFLRNHVLQN